MAAQHHFPSTGRAAPAAGAALWVPRLDRTSTMPLSRQLTAALRQALAGGSFGHGARLPSTRSLAAELGIARSTVVAVFEQLATEGYIEPRQGSGYFVATPLTAHADLRSDIQSARAVRATSRHAKSLRLVVPDWRKSPRPFETGYAEVDNRLIASWKRLAPRALSARTRLNWDYGDPQGEPVLRQAIAEYLAAARGVRCRPEQIVVISGTQQGLSLAARILIEPGDPVWVEDPCYRSAVEILRLAEACIAAIPARHGDALRAPPRAARLGRARRQLDYRGRLRKRVSAAGSCVAVAAGPRPGWAGDLSRHVQQIIVPVVAARLRGITGRSGPVVRCGAVLN